MIYVVQYMVWRNDRREGGTIFLEEVEKTFTFPFIFFSGVVTFEMSNVLIRAFVAIGL